VIVESGSERKPRVSVCIAAFNAAPWIRRAVRSVQAQTYSDFEVIVVDDASTDGTPDHVRALDDPRIRLLCNSRNLGQAGNWNRAVSFARGGLIKFLCADDVLYADCLETMVPIFDLNPQVGLVFSRRDVESDEPDVVAKWNAKHAGGHARFGDLGEVNSGPPLAARWIAGRLGRNWVGEPTNVMVSKACLDQIGGFNLRIRQRVDMDLWIRAMFFFDVGFVNRPLARYSLRSGSVSDVNRTSGRSWLDQLWLLEGLLTYDEIREGWPELYTLRRRAARKQISHALRSMARADRQKLKDLADYVAVRVRRNPFDAQHLYGSVRDQGRPGETVEQRASSS
jgi:glycosyltransferase involved in cell wall biosynthesis